MDHIVAEDLEDVLKDTKEISGSVEKLVRGRWCERWLTLHVSLASIHYYQNKNDQENGKVRGIYPLTGVKAEEDSKEENAYYEFAIVFQTSKKIRFRTVIKKQSRAWCMIINHLATRHHKELNNPLEATLSMKSRTSWSTMTAKLDVDSNNLYLRKGDWQDVRYKQDEAFCLKDAAVRPLKSYGKTFDFEISMTSPQKKHVELRFRAPTESDRTMWCQALQRALDVQKGLQRSPKEGNKEGKIFVREIVEEVPGGKSMREVVLEGIQGFSPKVLTRVKYYLQPHPIIHIGDVSKVYHTTLNFVTVALMNAGFTPAPQDSSTNLVFEIKTVPSTSVCPRPTIKDIVKVLWPTGFFSSPSRSPLPSPGNLSDHCKKTTTE
ncbi:uncharacterized protein [Palaemon carinicauda]|uniref:uncharacterized protein n=1 Tax=Palaemon carinicauda TaxID=392227 RepID=UPI0035B577BA